MKRKRKPTKSKWGIDAHRACRAVKKRMMGRFFDENEELFERYRRGEIY